MSTTSCAGNDNPVARLFQDVGISSSKALLSNIENGRKNTTNSFRSSTSSLALWADDSREWDNYIQQSVVNGGGNQFSKEFSSFFMPEENKEEEEEFRQEWSDEHFTQLYIKQNALELHKNIRTRRHSYSQTSVFVQEFLQNSSNSINNNHQKITTNHCDLFQAQLYLFDHLLSAILSYPITCRPSATAEWNWDRLFSPTRWCSKEEEENDEDDKVLQDEYLKHVAIGRLQLLLGHLINTDDPNSNKQNEKSGWEWEWEFYNS